MSFNLKEWKPRVTQLHYLYHFSKGIDVIDPEIGLPSFHTCAHRRAGKSEGVAVGHSVAAGNILREKSIFKIKGDISSRYPKMAFVAETQVQARNIIWDVLQDVMSVYPGMKANNNRLTITIPRPLTGDHLEYKLLASRNHNSIRGQRFRLLHWDEVQLATEEGLNKSAIPALTDQGGLFSTSGTATSVGHYPDMIRHALSVKVPTFLFPVTHTGVFNLAQQNDIRKKIGEDAWMQEYMCSFKSGLKGAFYADILAKLEREGQHTVEYDPSLTTLLVTDLGVAESFASFIIQYDPVANTINVLDYFDDYLVLDALRKDIDAAGYKVDVVVVPHDAVKRQLGAYHSTRIKQLFNEVWPECIVSQVKKTQSKMAVISNVASNLHMLRWPPKGASTDAFRGYNKLKAFRRKLDSDGLVVDAIDKTNKADHAADAMGYGFQFLKVKNNRVNREVVFKAGNRSEGITLQKSGWHPLLKNKGSLLDVLEHNRIQEGTHSWR